MFAFIPLFDLANTFFLYKTKPKEQNEHERFTVTGYSKLYIL